MSSEPLDSEAVMRKINISTTEKTTVFMKRIIAKGEFGGSGNSGTVPEFGEFLGQSPNSPELPFSLYYSSLLLFFL